jgi:hypothetical protein
MLLTFEVHSTTDGVHHDKLADADWCPGEEFATPELLSVALAMVKVDCRKLL